MNAGLTALLRHAVCALATWMRIGWAAPTSEYSRPRCRRLRRRRGLFCVLVVAPNHETCLEACRKESDALRALGWAVEGFQQAGYVLVRCDRYRVHLQRYIPDLDVFADSVVVVEYVATSSRRGRPALSHQSLLRLRRQPVVLPAAPPSMVSIN